MKVRSTFRNGPVGPLTGDRKTAKVGISQAEQLDARYFPDLQDNEPAPAKGMEGMGNLSRSQGLFEWLCSSKCMWQPSRTA